MQVFYVHQPIKYVSNNTLKNYPYELKTFLHEKYAREINYFYIEDKNTVKKYTRSVLSKPL